MENEFSDIRNDYGDKGLIESELPSEPIRLTNNWLNEAIKEGLYEPTAITLSTIDSGGFPSLRIVLLKDIQKGKLIFFSNYDSAKAMELDLNPNASLLFFWPQSHRQIRIKGKVEKLSSEESDEYFKQRPEESKLGAWASPQSEVIKDRSFLELNYKKFEKKFNKKIIPRPEFWGGYIFDPLNFEFWQGRSKRLHDRLVYSKKEGDWTIRRLAP